MEMSSVKKRLQSIYIGTFSRVTQELETGRKQKLQDIFTDLCIIEGLGGVNDEHELSSMRVRQDETRTTSGIMKTVQLSDLFSDHFHTGEPVKRVLTLGIAGVGKTLAVKKFVLDWAEEKQSQSIHLIVVLPFRELNMHTDGGYRLFDLLQKFYPECEELAKALESKETSILFVLDGLDESRMELKFTNCISDPTKKASVAVLISSLIAGKLLSSALIWVTSRPAAAKKKLQDRFDLVTEIQGFSDEHRKEYFERVFPDRHEEILAQLRKNRSLYIMCHVPVFCHMIAVVLGGNQGKQCQEIPKTLTEMYARYCVLQITRMNDKYSEQETEMLAEAKEEETEQKAKDDLLIKLGKLAFKYLERDTLIFYKKDLRDCGIDVKPGVQTGLCTQIFREEAAECGKNMFSFVHLSVQEFLAALYMLHMHATGQTNVFKTHLLQKVKWFFKKSRFELYKDCLDRALQSQNGHLDLFVRFLLGLAPLLEPKLRYPLDEILPHLSEHVKEMSIPKTVNYIKRQISESSSPERIINLFHCLSELGDNTLVEEINRYTSSSAEHNLTPVQCSTLAYLQLTSVEVLEEFDLRKYLRSEEGLHRMLPLVSISKRVQLNKCHLSKASCGKLASTLQEPHSNLQELDMSDNVLQDEGVELLCGGLKAPQCKLVTLRLNRCHLSKASCGMLASTLQGSHSNLQELDMSDNALEDEGVELLCEGLKAPQCKLAKLRINRCHLSKASCGRLASALQASHSNLQELDMSDNVLQDEGVELLCEGLKAPQCKLAKLRLSLCLISEKGCTYLAAALTSNPSHLKELDLSYNHPGESGLKILSSRLEDPHCKLLSTHCGRIRLTADVRRYACDVTLDPITANKYISISEGNRKMNVVDEKQSYPEHPDRFDNWDQVLCREGLSGRSYWEVEWRGDRVDIAVAYKSVDRKVVGHEGMMGLNAKSWSLYCSNTGSFSVWHITKYTDIPRSSCSRRVGVYLDWLAGTLSFYSVSSDTLTHLYTFRTTFTEPLYPGFKVVHGYGCGSSVSLCQIT
ncbi:NACHT, LRR and PYD domains-containing protein 12-like [Engraulis encrasicolus]|uniref:NACHT, LRR and PYD domains-containing protein 12-like n=1 Tax=Engraulis encrasicolus TaxID=184585 RepID=UPI002FD40F33